MAASNMGGTINALPYLKADKGEKKLIQKVEAGEENGQIWERKDINRRRKWLTGYLTYD